MTLAEAIERRDKLQAAYDALLLGERVVEVKFADHTVSYQSASIKVLAAELRAAKKLVAQLSGTRQRARPSRIRHSGGY